MASRSDDSRFRGATGAFILVAYLEAASYLALLAAVVTYRVFDGPDFIGTLGPIHGIAFIVYVLLLLRIRPSQGWGFWSTILVLAAAVVPFGGFWAGRHVVEERVPAASGGAETYP